MKPKCYTYATDPPMAGSSAKLNTLKLNFMNMCGSIIPLKSKLYYDEKINIRFNTYCLIFIKSFSPDRKGD